MPDDGRFAASQLAVALAPLRLYARLAGAARLIRGRLVFTTSFGLEDQVVTDAIARAGLAVDIVTLDTGRLFPETHDLWAETERRYGLAIAAFVPEAGAVEALVGADGVNGFRTSVEARKRCCGVRKVAPLYRALRGASGWITGLRSSQSAHRARTPLAEFDSAHGLVKINPLADWRRDEVAAYVAENRVPYNPLHDRGFASIGCSPCTRAVRAGEHERAGRWWWEGENKKECGLHNRPPPASADSRVYTAEPS